MDSERRGSHGEMVEIKLEFPARRDGDVDPGDPRGPNRWLLCDSPFLSDALVWLGDVVETEPTPEGRRFVRVVERSPLRTWDRMIPRAVAEIAGLEAQKARIAAVGGEWEQVFGGVFVAHLPPSRRWTWTPRSPRSARPSPRRVKAARKWWRFRR